MHGVLRLFLQFFGCIALTAASAVLFPQLSNSAELNNKNHSDCLTGSETVAVPVFSSESYANYLSTLLANESCTLIEKRDYEGAMEKLHTAYMLAPQSAAVNANIGLVLNRTGQSEKAIKYLEAAVSSAPEEAAPLLTLASAYERSGQLLKAADAYELFSKNFPEDRDIALVKGILNGIRNELAVSKSAEESKSGDDYVAAASSRARLKWNKPGKRLAVFIEEESCKTESSKKAALIKAFKDWEISGCFSFELVSRAEESDISCYWTSRAEDMANPAEGGEARLSYQSLNITHSEIKLLTTRGKKEASPEDIHAAALHEIGHALGIAGHSPAPADIMYCLLKSEGCAATLSERDLHTLQRLYPELTAAFHAD